MTLRSRQVPLEPTAQSVAQGEIGSVTIPDPPRHIFHVFPSFEIGGVQVRTATIMSHLSDRYRHTILALDGNYQCRSRIDEDITVTYRTDPPSGSGLVTSFGRPYKVLKATRPDLLVTYNWGTMDWALTNAIFRFCPQIHQEDGFNLDECDGQKLRRILYRRLSLGYISRLIVPSQSLHAIASKTWKIDPARLVHIPNGIDAGQFELQRSPCRPAKIEDLVVIGTIAPLRPDKNLQMLIEVVAMLGDDHPVGLLIAGDGAERSRLEGLTRACELEPRTVFLGHVDDIGAALSMIDIFALTSKTEQMPMSILQAMAAAKPIAAVDVGDVKNMISAENRPFIVPRDDANALSRSLRRFVEDQERRQKIGRCNVDQVRAHYREDVMVEAYADLFAAALDDGAGQAQTPPPHS